MATAVWMLYVADRLLDVKRSDAGEFEERHYFHLRHRAGFLAGITVASFALALLLPTIPAEAMRLYLVLGGLVAGYFVVIHATQSAHRLPKEMAVGVCFAAAVFIPTVARAPHLRIPLLAPAILLAAFCSLNCLFIYAWEHPEQRTQGLHPLTAVALRRLVTIDAGVALTSAALVFLNRGGVPWQLYGAVAISSTGILWLHSRHRKYQAVTMRAAADLVLLTPFLLAMFA
ncbi:MAG TPA: hypothetical protein VIM60_07810 [Edaphobacter sp.]